MNAIDAVIGAVVAALRQAPAVCALIDEDIDAEAVAESATAFISVRHDGSTPQQRAAVRGHPVEWITDVIVECYARGDSPSASGRASRTLAGAAYARLMASPSLGGIALDLQEPTIATDSDKSDRRNGCTVAVFPVLHRTQAGTLEQPT